jgi:hypothetical protein
VQVAVRLNLSQNRVWQYQREFWRLNGYSKLEDVYQDLNGNISPIVRLHKLIEKKDIKIEKLYEAVEVINKLENLTHIYELREKELKAIENQIETAKRCFANLNDNDTTTLTVERQLGVVHQN